ncbi:hypothetical protein [Anaeromyxobacter terrae]|uniref:hypothetical protein n=1 Tax=Anaeromyxobacter terrae TaxID=2925406 RepID=UPI001F5AECB3|nr:hypothetical protein [Anaeromyxobacter sp. SG22]
MPRLYMLLASLLAPLAVLAFVFVRASVEVGEERVWLFAFVTLAPVPVAAALVWSLNGLSWPRRLGTGAVALVLFPVLLIQCAKLADDIDRNPKAFRLVLPVVIGAESLYLRTMDADPWRRQRHEEKRERWRRAASPDREPGL